MLELSLSLFFKDFIYLFLEREEGREKERERNINVWLPLVHGDLVNNPGMWPDWELKWRPFGLQAGAQSIEPHQPGLVLELLLRLLGHRGPVCPWRL